MQAQKLVLHEKNLHLAIMKNKSGFIWRPLFYVWSIFWLCSHTEILCFVCAILISASSFSEFNKICRSNESGLDELLSLYVKNHALGAWLCFLCKNIISSIMLFLQVRFAAALF